MEEIYAVSLTSADD